MKLLKHPAFLALAALWLVAIGIDVLHCTSNAGFLPTGGKSDDSFGMGTACWGQDVLIKLLLALFTVAFQIDRLKHNQTGLMWAALAFPVLAVADAWFDWGAAEFAWEFLLEWVD